MVPLRISPLPTDTALDITACAIRLASILKRPVEFAWHGKSIVISPQWEYEHPFVKVVERLRGLR